MNSLNYLSRQFDVLASAKTPPSTPTSEHATFIGNRRNASGSETPLQRVKTWSTKSFLFAPTSRPSPMRSYSSPAGFIARVASLSPAAAATSVSLETKPLPQSSLDSFIDQIFFVRVLVLAWDTLRSAWLSLLERTGAMPKGGIAIEVVPAAEEKDSDEETVEDISSLVSSSPQSTSRISPPTPRIPSLPNVGRSLTDPVPPYDTDAEPQTPLNPSSQSALAVPPSETPLSASRSSTPILSTRKTPFHLPKTLVLDLDETLIHSTSRPMSSSEHSSGLFGLGPFGRGNKGAGHVVEVVLGGRSTLYHVYKRPFADFFLRTVSGWYTLVIFTASMQEYADPVIDWLDAGRGILDHRLFRDSCTQLPNGSYSKDLSVVEPDLTRVCLIDNSPISYSINEANGVPIEGWTHDPSDEALLDLLPVLDSLRFTSDVRRVLGLRSAGGSS